MAGRMPIRDRAATHSKSIGTADTSLSRRGVVWRCLGRRSCVQAAPRPSASQVKLDVRFYGACGTSCPMSESAVTNFIQPNQWPMVSQRVKRNMDESARFTEIVCNGSSPLVFSDLQGCSRGRLPPP